MLTEGFINLKKSEMSNELEASAFYNSTHRVAVRKSPTVHLDTGVLKKKVLRPSQEF
jgi:hypothetical protein